MLPFTNIRVLDLTHVLAGPFATYQLAVLGAEVIKVEPPQTPDISRVSGAPHPHPDLASDLSSDFTAQNANKRAISLNLKTPAAQKILRRLIKTADILVENYRPGALAKLKLDYPAVRKIQPKIIYCSITGFGQSGANAPRTAYDNIIQAYSGLMAATGEPPETNAPLKVGPPVLDYGTGIHAAFAIAAALYHRTQTGHGQHLDIAMLDAALMLMSSTITHYHHSRKLPQTRGNNSPVNAGYACYPTKNGLLMLGAYNATQAQRMWRVLGHPAYADKLTHLTPLQFARHAAQHRATETTRIRKRLKTQTAAHWETEFNRHQVPAARVRTLDETLADPHLQTRPLLQTPPQSQHPLPLPLPVVAFKTTHPNNPATPPKNLNRPPPTTAQHTREILTQLGYPEPELQKLHKQGIIHLAQTN